MSAEQWTATNIYHLYKRHAALRKEELWWGAINKVHIVEKRNF